MLKLCLLITIFTVGQAFAHDLWIEREGDRCVLYSGHRHSNHPGEERIPYPPEIVLRVRCFDADGNLLNTEPGGTYPVEFSCEGAIAYAMTSTGYWTKTPYGTKNLPKDEVTGVLKSWLSFESVKRIDRWGENAAVPLTSGLELIPLNNLVELEKGDKLRLRVTFEKKPVKGAVVSYDGHPRGESGEDGRINIRLRHDGFQVIQASYSLPLDSEKADRVVHTTNLNFEIGTGQ